MELVLETVFSEKNLIQICFLILFANTLLHWITIPMKEHQPNDAPTALSLSEGFDQRKKDEACAQRKKEVFAEGSTVFREFFQFFPRRPTGGGRFVDKISQLQNAGMLLANSCLTVLLLERWYSSGHLPFSNLYESFLFLSWTLSFGHLLLQTKLVGTPQLWYQSAANSKLGYESQDRPSKIKISNAFMARYLGAITAPSVMLTQSFASFSLPTEMQKSTALVPALQSNWLMMHVSMMILSYGALLIGSLLAVTLLVISRALPLQKTQSVSLSRTKQKEDHFLPGRSYSILETAPLSSKYPLGAVPGCFAFNLETHPIPKGFFLETNLRIEVLALEQLFFQARKTRLLQQMDNWSYRAIGIGFPLLTVGILSGAVWANEAWGSYWSWDPKETWALVTWVIFAVYLHTRMTKGWTGDRPAFVALLGLLVVWICYLGVNLLGQGLHSYGWLN